MFNKFPNIRIDRVDNIEIYSPNEPYIEKTLYRIVKELIKKDLIDKEDLLFKDVLKSNGSKSLKIIDLISKAITIVSGIGITVFIILLFFGVRSIGTIQVSSLLTVISFTLVSGFISIGGVKLFNFNASLRKNEFKVDKYLNEIAICPFQRVFKLHTNNSNWKNHKPGNPDFCIKCPLAIDTIDDKERGFLIHNCSIYKQLHDSWLLSK